MNKRNIGIAVVTLLLIIGGTVWALRSRADAQLEKVREMRKEAFGRDGPRDPEKRKEFDRAMKQLSPEQHEQLWEERAQARERGMDEQIDKYFAAPPAERTAMLDKQLLEEEKRQKEWAAHRAQSPRSQNQARQAGPPAGQQGGGPNANRGPSNRGNRTAEQQSASRNKRLDRATPQQRAKRTAYMADLQQRRKALGLPMTPPGRGRRG